MKILTGIQPSGIPHIGNYFAMLKPVIELQDQGEPFVFIADYHSLTSTPDPDDLRTRSLEVAIDALACGLDPRKTVFFRQSDVPQVAELTWILNNSISVSHLERAHSYKDKVENGFVPNNGLFSYPVLMASDILIYDSDIVPVGKDQKQHVEITRDIAQTFNNRYGEIFHIPEAKIKNDVGLIPGTDGRKMSKSYNNTIEIFGKPKKLRKKIMRIKTDSKGLEDKKNPDKCNVFALYKLFADKNQIDEMRNNYINGGYGYGHAKQALFELMQDYFANFAEKRREIEENPDYVLKILQQGAEKASSVAEAKMLQIRKAVGLR